jgi:2-hydroxy-6-oxonona-2,4-dienedioate hydrolase
MAENKTSMLRLDDNDPLVIAAKEAEARLYQAYDLTPRHHYVALGSTGIRVRVSEVGEGEPIVVVPGNTGDVFPLIPLMAAMKGWRFVAINRPGGGLSDGMDHRTVDLRRFAVQTLESVMAELGLEQANVLAQSIGAQWSFWLAMDRPHLLRRLVTLGNPGNVMNGRPPLALRVLSRWPFNRLLPKLITPNSRDRALRPLRMMGHVDTALGKLPPAYTDCYFHFRRLPYYQVSAVSLLSNPIPPISGQELAGVAQPISLIWGTKDTFGTASVASAIAQALPHGELHMIKGAGHLPWIEEPALCGRLAIEFLQR